MHRHAWTVICVAPVDRRTALGGYTSGVTRAFTIPGGTPSVPHYQNAPSNMKTSIRCLSLAVASTLLAHAASAQSLSIYGAAEAAGLGESSAILGASVGTGRQGWNPIAGINFQTYTFRLSPTSTATNTAVVPSVGLEYRTHVGSVQGTVGYNFTNRDSKLANLNVPVVGGTGGGENSPVVGLQGNYWGGIYEHQAIISYSTKSEYTWSRFRLGARPMATTPLYLGAQAVLQGTNKFGGVHRYQVGPTINYHFSPNFHLGGSTGLTIHSDDTKTGYASVEFVILPRL